MKDELFKQNFSGKFEFNEAVAVVFDDMITRSIPFYDEFIKNTTALVNKFCAEGDRIYDFGCSTANTLLAIERSCKNKYELIGIDTSEHMLRQAASKIAAYNSEIVLVHDDILNTNTSKAQCVISNFTMQFIKPEIRMSGFEKAFDTLSQGGIFIFAEKLASPHGELNDLMTERYYEYKKHQGYSELEIMQKRSALETVLIPFSEEKNIEYARSAGFSHAECIFRVLNFALFVAFKA